MKLDYLLDISEESSSVIHTPSLISQKLPFYIHNWGHFYAGSGYFTEREGQDNYLLIYTVSGSGTINYKGMELSCGPGQVFFIDCNDYHYYKTGPDGLWEIKWLHFNGSACPNYFNLINEDSLNMITLTDPSEVERHLDEIPPLILKNDIYNDVKFSMLVTNILTEMITNKLNPQNNKMFLQHYQLISRATTFIQSKYSQRINLKDILKVVHVSEYHFVRLFKKYTGVGPYEYLINYRINKSKQLLKETGLTVNEIAYKVGFSNINNFIRDFKKLVGTTPLKYRNFWIT